MQSEKLLAVRRELKEEAEKAQVAYDNQVADPDLACLLWDL